VIAAARMIRLIASSDREDRPRGTFLVAASAAVDAVAVSILLLGTPFSPMFDGLAASASHAAACVLLSGFAGARPSRRWLCVAAVLAVPCAGAAVAAVSLFTSGRGSVALERGRKARRRPRLTMADARRLAGALSPCDALEDGDPEQRRAALSALSLRRDPEAIALLRRAAAGRDPELALSAALVMDEIGERAERRDERRPAHARLRREAG